MACSPPAAVSGRMRRIKDVIAIVLIAGFILLPYWRWDRGPGEPSQAMLWDVFGHRLLFFDAEFSGSDRPMLFAVGIGLLALLLLAGRAWCGFACPQTLWMDWFFRCERGLERLFGGNRIAVAWGARLCQGLTALAAGYFFLNWFTDAVALPGRFFTGTASGRAYLAAGDAAVIVFVMGAVLREHFCAAMCPWTRLLTVFADEHSPEVSYDRARGDCIDCGACAAVCPARIDIRQGAQAGCIGCGLCVDACDGIMDQIRRPRGLVRFATRSGGRAAMVRAKNGMLAAVTAVALAAGGWAASHHDGEPPERGSHHAGGEARRAQEVYVRP